MEKKSIFLFAVLAASSFTFAQSFGVRAGLNLSRIEYDPSHSRTRGDYSYKETTDMTYSTGNSVGFHVGAVADIGINEFFYVQPGVLFTSKGGYEKEEYSSIQSGSYYSSRKDEDEQTITTYYIDVPVMFSLKGKINDNLALIAQAGPYIGFGLFGKMESEYKEERFDGSTVRNESEKTEVENVFSPTAKEKGEIPDENGETGGGFKGFNRFNAGIGFGGGIEISGFYVGVTYNYGLTNLYNDKESSKLYDRTLGITIGYNL